MNLKMIFMSLALTICLIVTVGALEYDGYIFKLKKDAPVLMGIENNSVHLIDGDNGLFIAQTKEDISAFTNTDNIEYVEPNYIVELFSAPNDIYYSNQWCLPKIGMEWVWDNIASLKEVKVGVIDSGIYPIHEDFDYEKKVLTGYNFLDNSLNTTDSYGHGTFVSGIIGAVRNNSKGVAGISSNAVIIPLKCFNSTTTSLGYLCTAIYRAVDVYKCEILNMSWGISTDTETLKNAINYASSKGVIMVSAVGNYSGTTLYYPAAYDNVIGVGSTNKNDVKATFSQYNKSVFVTAPGYNLYNTGNSSANSYKYGQGTSFSTPIITALAAIAKGLDPTITAEKFMSLLKETSTDLGDSGYDEYYGYGLVNAKSLFSKVMPKITFPPNITVLTQNSIIESGKRISAGTIVYINSALPQYLSPVIKVNGIILKNNAAYTIPYEDVNIEIEYNTPAISYAADGTCTISGYLGIFEPLCSATVVVAAYNSNNQMTYIALSPALSDENGFFNLSQTSLPIGNDVYKIMLFPNIKSLTPLCKSLALSLPLIP